MFHFASKGGYYLSVAFIQERPLIEHIQYVCMMLGYEKNKQIIYRDHCVLS